MPIPIEDYATPSFFRLQERYPGTEGREGGWKQAGYNPNHQSTRVEQIRVRSDDITLKPY
jgi:hypothetical protein